jgi:Tfp pilus assembly protein PilF
LDPTRAYSNKGLGLCLAKQGRVEQGLPYLREAIRLEPEWFDPRWDMAIVLMDAGRHAEALTVLDHATIALPSQRERIEQLRREVLRRASEAQPH